MVWITPFCAPSKSLDAPSRATKSPLALYIDIAFGGMPPIVATNSVHCKSGSLRMNEKSAKYPVNTPESAFPFGTRLCREGDAVGPRVGAADGLSVGAAVGETEGAADGSAVGVIDGAFEGDAVGDAEGVFVGEVEGAAVGSDVGSVVGSADGIADGKTVGSADGVADGLAVGPRDGIADGAAEGIADGSIVGGTSGHTLIVIFHSAPSSGSVSI